MVNTRIRTAALLLGIGMGGFVDGILLHQIVHWHNMLSAVVPPTTVEAMQLNMRADGLFHAATWIVTFAGCSAAPARAPSPSGAPATSAAAPPCNENRGQLPISIQANVAAGNR